MSYGLGDRLGRNVRLSAAGVLIAVVLIGAPFVLGGFQTSLLTRTVIFALFATAFNLLFGHAMFVAVAGYTVVKTFTVISPMLGLNEMAGGLAPLVTLALAIVLGVIAATIVAVLIGYLSVQLTEIYFALITLAFSMAIFVIFLQDAIGQVLAAVGIGNGNFSNGSDGLTFIPGEVDLFGWEFALVNLIDPMAFYFIALLIVAPGIYLIWRIIQSPFGVVCQAIRENPERAEALGINVTFHQWMAFIISGVFSGLAGTLLITLGGNVNPEAHAHWSFSANPVLMTIIGGPYSFIGPTLGAFTLEYVRWIIRQFPLLEEHWEFSLGVILLVVVLFFDNGVAGGINWLRARFGSDDDEETVAAD
jgi:branched-chain amino acid transport system permease protein